MKVRLIKADWDSIDQPQWMKNILMVGDALPELNQIYTVKTKYVDLKNCEVEAYELEEFDFSSYTIETDKSVGVAGFFNAKRFEIIPTPFENNSYLKSDHPCLDGPCREEKYLIGISGKLLNIMDLKIKHAL